MRIGKRILCCTLHIRINAIKSNKLMGSLSVHNLDAMTHEPKQNPAQFVTINCTHCDLQWHYRRVYFNQNVIYDPFLGIYRNLHQQFFIFKNLKSFL